MDRAVTSPERNIRTNARATRPPFRVVLGSRVCEQFDQYAIQDTRHCRKTYFNLNQFDFQVETLRKQGNKYRMNENCIITSIFVSISKIVNVHLILYLYSPNNIHLIIIDNVH